MVCLRSKDGDVWLPFTGIKDITNEGPQFVAPRSIGAHAQVRLNGGEILRIVGRTAAEVAADINRQIVAAGGWPQADRPGADEEDRAGVRHGEASG